MSSSRIPSPARSQGAKSTPRRYKPRASRSVCSPARSASSVKLSAVVMSQMDFELSPLPARRSVLADTTEIEAPRRRSWWKKLNENSREVMEALNTKETVEVNEVEELIEVVVPSQEKENYTFDLPESSDNESISSIVIPQRMLFTHKDNQQHNKFAQIIDPRKSITKLQKSNVEDENAFNVGPKNLFNHGSKPRNKPIFPSGLLNISANKTVANKTKEMNANDVKGQVKSLFGSRPGTKRKNMFVDFVVSESDDEIPEIRPKVFGFQKDAEQSHKPITSQRNRRESSPSSITDIEIDEWRLLPSSTMVDHQLEDGLRTTPSKRTRLGKLSEATESTANKTKPSNKSISIKNKSKNVSKFKEIEVNETFVPINDNELDGSMNYQNNRTRKSVRKTNTSLKNISHEKRLRSQNRSLNHSKKDASKSTGNTTTNQEQDKANTKITELENQEISHKIDTNDKEINSQQNTSEYNNADNNIDKNQYEEQNSQKVIDINHDNEIQYNSLLKTVNTDKVHEKSHIGEENKGITEDKQMEIDENGLIPEGNDQNDVQKSTQQTQAKDASKESEDEPVEDICLRMEDDEEEIQQESNVESKAEDEEEEANENDKDDIQDMEDGKTDTSNVNVNQENEYGEEEDHQEKEVESETEDQEEHDQSENSEKGSDQNIDQDTDNEEEEVPIEQNDVSDAENNELEDSNNVNINEESDNDEEMQELNNEEDNNEGSNVSHDIENDNTGSRYEKDIDDDPHKSKDEDIEESNTSRENVSQEEEPESAEEMEEDDEDREELQSSQEVEPENASEMEDDTGNDGEVDNQEDDSENESQDVVDNEIANNDDSEIEENSEVNEQDTTGRHGKKQSEVSSPEAVLQNKTNQMDSFAIQGRNTSVRKTKSIIKALNIRPSLAPRESTGFSDGTRDSSAEGSGWDSHRTTRVTLRKTFGKDFTPRKSLRALVMEKSAKRQTAANFAEANEEISKLPQANSTELPAEEPMYMQDDIDDVQEFQESDHEESRRQRQTTLEMYLQKVKRENMERRKQLQEEVKNSLKAPKKDAFNFFKVPAVPKRRAPLQTKPKAKPKTSSAISLDMLPPQLLEDLKYKPPKRYRPASASWITKRLYSYLETKLEPKYDYKARVRSEKLVEMIHEFTKSVRRHTNAPADAVNELKHEMARLEIVKTHFEFYEFFHEYMPREVRVKVVPDAFNNIPLPKHGVFSDILR